MVSLWLQVQSFKTLVSQKTAQGSKATHIKIKKTLGIAFFHLNVAKIRKMLSVHDAEKLVHDFVTSRLGVSDIIDVSRYVHCIKYCIA